jgi:hypothetical protein
MKTAELTGALLDYWVARTEGDRAKIKLSKSFAALDQFVSFSQPMRGLFRFVGGAKSRYLWPHAAKKVVQFSQGEETL